MNILFYSTSRAYYGRLISTSHVNVQRQRIQAEIGHNETFKLEMSKESLMQRFAIRLLFCVDMREAEMKIFIE